MLGWFMNQRATIQAVQYPQDSGGGEVPTPRQVEVLVPCCVQQDAAASQTEGQGRRGSTAGVRVFFGPTTPPQLDAVRQLQANDRIAIAGRDRPIVLDGPALDMAGRGVVWQADGRDVR